jgi:predicted PurR-regulated permease PerM
MENEPPAPSPQFMPDNIFVRRVLIFFAIAALAAALWTLSELLILVFGSILFAVVLRAIAEPIRRATSMGERWALFVAGLGIIVVLGIVSYLFGSKISGQLVTIAERLPDAADSLTKQMPFLTIPELLRDTSIGSLLMSAFSWGTTIFGALFSLVVMIVAGVYIAINPLVYVRGFVRLFPSGTRDQISATLNDAGHALRRWLGAQLIAMIIVGTLIGVGLAVVGVPSALALGLIAGVAEFVPIIGPVIGAIPALLLASTESVDTVLWTLAVFVVVQQLESNLIMPIVAGRVVELPPAVGLFAVVALGILFGPLGLVLGYPLAIVIDVAVKRLYLSGVLKEPVHPKGEKDKLNEPI